MDNEVVKTNGEPTTPETKVETEEVPANTSEVETEVKKSQSREDDAKFASLRRKQEQLEKENAEFKKQIEELKKHDSESWGHLKENVSDETLNDLSLDRENLDSEALKLIDLYNKAKKEGDKNPSSTAYATLYRENLKEKSVKVEREKSVQKSIEEAEKSFGPDVVKECLKTGSEFMSLYGDIVEPNNLSKLITSYNKLKAPKNSNNEDIKKYSVPPTIGKGTQETDTEIDFNTATSEQKYNYFKNKGYYK